MRGEAWVLCSALWWMDCLGKDCGGAGTKATGEVEVRAEVMPQRPGARAEGQAPGHGRRASSRIRTPYSAKEAPCERIHGEAAQRRRRHSGRDNNGDYEHDSAVNVGRPHYGYDARHSARSRVKGPQEECDSDTDQPSGGRIDTESGSGTSSSSSHKGSHRDPVSHSRYTSPPPPTSPDPRPTRPSSPHIPPTDPNSAADSPSSHRHDYPAESRGNDVFDEPWRFGGDGSGRFHEDLKLLLPDPSDLPDLDLRQEEERTRRRSGADQHGINEQVEEGRGRLVTTTETSRAPGAGTGPRALVSISAIGYAIIVLWLVG